MLVLPAENRFSVSEKRGLSLQDRAPGQGIAECFFQNSQPGAGCTVSTDAPKGAEWAAGSGLGSLPGCPPGGSCGFPHCSALHTGLAALRAGSLTQPRNCNIINSRAMVHCLPGVNSICLQPGPLVRSPQASLCEREIGSNHSDKWEFGL